MFVEALKAHLTDHKVGCDAKRKHRFMLKQIVLITAAGL